MIQTETYAPQQASDHHASACREGYSLWEYDGRTWSLKKDCSVSGAVSGGSPTVAGKFRGQLRMIPSVIA